MPTRKSPADKIAALQEKLKAAKTEARIADQKRFAVLGETIAGLMAQDAGFQALVAEKLKMVNAKNKADLAPFLVTPKADAAAK